MVNIFFEKFMTFFLVIIGVCVPFISEAAISAFSVSGDVEIRSSGEQTWRFLKSGDRVKTGDRIRSGHHGNASLVCRDDGSELHLASETRIVLEEFLYDKAQQRRVLRVTLAGGTLSVHVQKLGFLRYKLTRQSLETLRQQAIPETFISTLSKFPAHEYSDEQEFLAELEKRIPKQLSVRYLLPILESADSGQEVFIIETPYLQLKAADEAVMTVKMDQQARRQELLVKQGRVTAKRSKQTGDVSMFGLLDDRSQEGIRFSSARSEGLVRITVNGCKIFAETSMPVERYEALMGQNANLLGLRNEKGSPVVTVLREGEKAITLEEGEEILLGRADNHPLRLEPSDVSSLSFDFCKRFSSFVFAVKGCFENKGQEECCGDLLYEESDWAERPFPPFTADEDPDRGGYAPPESPPSKPGSPVQP